MAKNVQAVNAATNDPIFFTDAAACKVKQLIDEEENIGLSTYKNGNWSNIVFNKFISIIDNANV